MPTFIDADALSTPPFLCVNCFTVLPPTAGQVKLYCAPLCVDEADWVRYVRDCGRDGRARRPDVKEAIQIRLALILGGGYDRRARALSSQTRHAVMERDRGRCCVCGDVGTEVDHRDGSSSALANLQLLCNACHNRKTIAGFTKITPESHPQEWAQAQRLKHRTRVRRPLQLCDSDDWETHQKGILRRRRDVVSGQRSLFDGR